MPRMSEREIARARRSGKRSTMNPGNLDTILDQAQGKNGEPPIILSPLGATPKRWIPSLRAPRKPVPTIAPRTLAVLAGLTRGRRGAFIWATTASLLGAIASALVPWAMGNAIDAGITHGLGIAFAHAALIFIGIVALVAIGDSAGNLGELVLWNTGEFQGRRLVAHRLADRPRALKRSHSGGDIVTAASDDANKIGQLYTDIPEILAVFAAVSLVSYLMLTTSTPLGLTILIGMPISLILLSVIARPLEKRQEAVRTEQGKLTTIATDAVQGLRILRGIGGEDAYAAAYEKQSDKLRQVSIQAAFTASLLNTVHIAIPMLLITIVVAQGAYLAYYGYLTVGQLLSFYGFTLYMRHAMWIATRLVDHFTGSRVGARRIASLLNVPDLTSDNAAHTPAPEINWAQATLTLNPAEGLTLAQPLTLKPQKLTALLTACPDHSASLAQAYARIEDPSSLTINDTPAQTIPLTQIREKILLSEATPHLFAGTLREDLLAARAPLTPPRGVTETIWRHQLDSAATSEEGAITPTTHPEDPNLIRALELAHAGDAYTSLHGGLDGRLAEKGRNLSGGQRQRLALARAYAANADILILIEPTSALDAHTEALIAADLPTARSGQTTLIVTQSPLFLAQMDEIIVLDENGSITAQGSYDELRNSSADLHRILNIAENSETEDAQ